ncbi:aldo/keto reductase [Nocardia sp. alder85J]|uniref:aldo/keto reductase n=1 Tax=Nocardia sp. alder85J TaxID=2862949 RepID=UPI001CD5C68B|nr:aldo/keto reductase [Nocardia sp. alder85J]MCX4093909.1 aldo/keto reductase [Nocardia sp. alder85J]
MSLRPLGTSSLEVSPIVFGGNVFGWTVDESASFALLDALADVGINSVDSADGYSVWVPGNSGGESETIIGRWLQRSGKRDSVVVATKVGMLPTRPGLSRDNILRAAEDSLRRLQTDYIDLYYSHRDDAEVPQEETLGAYQTLIEQGKVRVIGASNFSADRLRSAAAISADSGLPAYQVIQPEYSLYARADYETGLEQVVTDLKLGVVTYRPLASGFLTGKYRSEADLGKSPRGQRGVAKYLEPRGLRILSALDAVADKHRVSQAAVAIGWQLTRPGITAPIASATSVEQLRELGVAAQLTLDVADLSLLAEASAG